MENGNYSEMGSLRGLVDRTKAKNSFLEIMYLKQGHTTAVSVTTPVFLKKEMWIFNAPFSRSPLLIKTHFLLKILKTYSVNRPKSRSEACNRAQKR